MLGFNTRYDNKMTLQVYVVKLCECSWFSNWQFHMNFGCELRLRAINSSSAATISAGYVQTLTCSNYTSSMALSWGLCAFDRILSGTLVSPVNPPPHRCCRWPCYSERPNLAMVGVKVNHGSDIRRVSYSRVKVTSSKPSFVETTLSVT